MFEFSRFLFSSLNSYPRMQLPQDAKYWKILAKKPLKCDTEQGMSILLERKGESFKEEPSLFYSQKLPEQRVDFLKGTHSSHVTRDVWCVLIMGFSCPGFPSFRGHLSWLLQGPSGQQLLPARHQLWLKLGLSHWDVSTPAAEGERDHNLLWFLQCQTGTTQGRKVSLS